MVDGRKPRLRPGPASASSTAGIEWWKRRRANRPLLVGERTNVIGSRLFKNLVGREKWEKLRRSPAAKFATARTSGRLFAIQHRDEDQGYPAVLRPADRKIKAPIMIDTTDPKSVWSYR